MSAVNASYSVFITFIISFTDTAVFDVILLMLIMFEVMLLDIISTLTNLSFVKFTFEAI